MSAKITRIGAAVREAGEAKGRRGGGALPEDCPVTPLGCSEEEVFFLNAIGQFVTVQKRHLNKLTIYGLFAPHDEYLRKHWPKTYDEATQTYRDFKPDEVARDLIKACAIEGAWDGGDRIRGRGAWLGEDGDLVQHLGKTLHVRGSVERPGAHGRYVYAVRPPRPGPAKGEQPAGPDGPAYQLEELLRCWRWRDAELHPRLLLGFICAGMLCGALKWRPHVWLHGERGSGKSTLVELMGNIFGRGEGCVVTADASAAGVRSYLRHDSLPVIFDEAEASEDNRRLNALVELARLAASGGQVLRGTAEHGSASFTIRFMGAFGSVLVPSLTSQDLSRIAFLSLRKILGGKPPARTEEDLGLLGRQLLRRMSDGWPRLRESLEGWRQALIGAGMDARGADQYGTLLAAAEVALHDGLPDTDTMQVWAERVADATREQRAAEMPEWARCLEHLASCASPQWRSGDQRSIGETIAIAAERKVLEGEAGTFRPDPGMAIDANRALQRCGMRVVIQTVEGKPVFEPGGTGNKVGHLAIANSHAALNALFRETRWGGRSGTDGAWTGALKEAPGAEPGKQAIRFAGATARHVLVPLDLVLGTHDPASPEG